jgi:CheY-like chemotaxis protein
MKHLPHEASSSPREVLVVEDEPQMRALLTDNLEFEGYHVTAVESGEQALEALGQRSVSLVLVDVMLPGMSGFNLCEQLRDRGTRVPIIILTARTHEQDRIRGLDLGADDYVSKPFRVRELLARVRAQVRRDDWRSTGDAEFTFGDVKVNVRQPTSAAVGPRVRAASLPPRPPERGRGSRAAATRCLGLQPAVGHPNRRQLHCQAADATRAAPARSTLHRDRARQWLSVAWITVRQVRQVT